MTNVNTIETRTLLLHPRGQDIVTPNTADHRLTFSEELTFDHDQLKAYAALEDALPNNTFELPTIKIQRYLGEFGLMHAYVATPHIGQKIVRNFAKQTRSIIEVENSLDSFDEIDAQIFTYFLERHLRSR